MFGIKKARQLGLTHYVGRPCPHCAKRVRYTSNRVCVFCNGVTRTREEERMRKARYRARQSLPYGASPLALVYALALAGKAP